jgi:hypothetical protein
MRAISLHQPFASSALIPDLKPHETRHWAASASVIGQRVAIHAAIKPIGKNTVSEEACAVLAQSFGADWRTALPRGALVGSVIVADCRPMDCMVAPAEPVHQNDYLLGVWGAGRFGWRLADPWILSKPVPWKGKQGWFNVHEDVMRRAA